MVATMNRLLVTSRDAEDQSVYKVFWRTVHTGKVTSLPCLPTYLISVC